MSRALGSDRFQFRVVIALGLLLALAVRLMTSNYSFWFDEWASLIFSDQPVANLWSRWMVRETNPPLFYTALKFWALLGAHNIVTLRLLPILAGVINIAIITWLCARYHSRRAAVIVVLLIAVSLRHVYMSQLLRGYIFAMLGASLSLAGIMLWWDSERRKVLGMTAYVLGVTLAFYSHTTMALLQFAAPLGVLLVRQREVRAGNWQIVRDLLFMGFAAAAASGWWVWISYLQLSGDSLNITWIEKKGLLRVLSSFVRNGTPLNLNVDLPTLAAYRPHGFEDITKLSQIPAWITIEVASLCFIVAVSIWSVGKSLNKAFTRLSLYIFTIVILLHWVAAYLHPITTDLTIAWLMLFVFIGLATSIAGISKRALRSGLVVVTVGILALNTITHRGQLELQDWRGALSRVSSAGNSGLLVQSEPMLVITQRACKFQFALPGCPFRLVGLHSESRLDSWARNMADQPPVQAEEAVSRLRDLDSVYTLRHWSYDPLVELGHSTTIPRTSWHSAFFEGPFPANSFAVPNRSR